MLSQLELQTLLLIIPFLVNEFYVNDASLCGEQRVYVYILNHHMSSNKVTIFEFAYIA